jgi:hypothetical protein
MIDPQWQCRILRHTLDSRSRKGCCTNRPHSSYTLMHRWSCTFVQLPDPEFEYVFYANISVHDTDIRGRM